MKRETRLWEKVCDLDNIYMAHKMASRDKLHRKEVEEVNADLDNKMRMVQAILQSMKWRPAKYKKFLRDERGKVREICKSPYYPDRIVRWAIMLVIEPRITKNLIDQCCASIPGRGVKRASDFIRRYLKDVEGTKYCLKIDISKFYGHIDHKIMLHKLQTLFNDKDLIENLRRFIESHEKGLPIGSYMSQYFANLYLSDFDHFCKEKLHLSYYVRYMDDVVCLAPSKEDLHRVKRIMDGWLAEHLNLRIKSNWQVFPVDSRGIDFLGFRFFHARTLLRRKLTMRMRQAMAKVAKRIRNNLRLRIIDTARYISYMGWIIQSKSKGFFAKYFLPVRGPILDRFRRITA